MSLAKFEKHLKARGRSETTIQRYLHAAKNFMEKTGKQSQFKPSDVTDYLAEQKSGSYKRFLFFVLKTFYKALDLPWPFEREDMPKLSDPLQPHFNLEEMIKVLKTVDEKGSLRDRALIHVAVITGARRQELRNLNREDYQKGRLHIKTAKRGKPRWRVLDPATREIMERYLKSRIDSYSAMFPGRQGRLTVVRLSRLLKPYLKMAGVDKPHAGYHSFRRGLVTLLHAQGLSAKEITEYLGWGSPYMVHRYIQLEPGEVEAKVREVHPFFQEEKEDA